MRYSGVAPSLTTTATALHDLWASLADQGLLGLHSVRILMDFCTLLAASESSLMASLAHHLQLPRLERACENICGEHNQSNRRILNFKQLDSCIRAAGLHVPARSGGKLAATFDAATNHPSTAGLT